MTFLSHITLQSVPTLKMIRYLAPYPYFSRNQSRNVFLHSIDYFIEDFGKVSNALDFRCDESLNEKELVAKYVGLYGESSNTWKILSGKLKVKPQTAKILSKIHKHQTPEVKGIFSPEENRIIIDYIKKNGYSWKNIEDVTINLSRRNTASVYYRYKKEINKLNTQNSYSHKNRYWTYEEDKLMLKHIIDDYNDNEIKTLPDVKFRIFEALGRTLNRSSNGCYSNWTLFMQPTLLTHIKGLPLHMNWEWKNHVRNYIIQEKIESFDRLDFSLLMKEICPGQTQRSLKHFITALKFKKCGNKHSSDTPLYEKISTSIEKYPKYCLIRLNENRKETHLKRSQKIIDCYQELKKTKHTANCE